MGQLNTHHPGFHYHDLKWRLDAQPEDFASPAFCWLIHHIHYRAQPSLANLARLYKEKKNAD